MNTLFTISSSLIDVYGEAYDIVSTLVSSVLLSCPCCLYRCDPPTSHPRSPIVHCQYHRRHSSEETEGHKSAEFLVSQTGSLVLIRTQVARQYQTPLWSMDRKGCEVRYFGPVMIEFLLCKLTMLKVQRRSVIFIMLSIAE
jgi:hypothetical protein